MVHLSCLATFIVMVVCWCLKNCILQLLASEDEVVYSDDESVKKRWNWVFR